jgi:hypothetical protein
MIFSILELAIFLGLELVVLLSDAVFRVWRVGKVVTWKSLAWRINALDRRI